MVCEDAQRGKRSLSMAWIEVAKAYDSVVHCWLSEMFTLHIWYTDSTYGLLRWWRSLLTAGTLELLPKRLKAKRSLLQYVLRKDCRKVMRSVLCCSYCPWNQSHGRYRRLRDTGYLSLYQLRSLTSFTSTTWSCLLLLRTSWNESWQSQRMEWNGWAKYKRACRRQVWINHAPNAKGNPL